MGCGGSKSKNVVEDTGYEGNGNVITESGSDDEMSKTPYNLTPMPEAAIRNAVWPDVPKSPTSENRRQTQEDDIRSTPLEPIVETKDESKTTNSNGNNNHQTDNPQIDPTTTIITADEQEEIENAILENGMLDGQPVFVEILTVEISEIPLQGEIKIDRPTEIVETNDNNENDIENGTEVSVEPDEISADPIRTTTSEDAQVEEIIPSAVESTSEEIVLDDTTVVENEVGNAQVEEVLATFEEVATTENKDEEGINISDEKKEEESENEDE